MKRLKALGPWVLCVSLALLMVLGPVMSMADEPQTVHGVERCQ